MVKLRRGREEKNLLEEKIAPVMGGETEEENEDEEDTIVVATSK